MFYCFYCFFMFFRWQTWFSIEKLIISRIFSCFSSFFHVSSLKNLIVHWFSMEVLAFLANFTYKIDILLTRHWYFHIFCSKTSYFFDFSIVFYYVFMFFRWKTWFVVEFLSNFMCFRYFHIQNQYFIESSLVCSCFFWWKTNYFFDFLLFFIVFSWFVVEKLDCSLIFYGHSCFLANFTYEIKCLLIRHWKSGIFHAFWLKN